MHIESKNIFFFPSAIILQPSSLVVFRVVKILCREKEKIRLGDLFYFRLEKKTHAVISQAQD